MNKGKNKNAISVLKEITTPALLLEEEKVRANIDFLSRRLTAHGVPLRPHGKTPKNGEIMEWAVKGQPGGITVSTLAEAEYYFEKGFRDITYAVGIAPGKISRVVSLLRLGARVSCLLDTAEQARQLSLAASGAGVSIPVLIEIDCDDHRGGLAPEVPFLTELGALITELPGITFEGVLTHAGASYGCASPSEMVQMAETERKAAVKAAERLKAAGIPCPVVSIGSTPTAYWGENFQGVTEVRAGVYLFQDLVMAGLGVCGTGDIALSVLTSVIGTQKEKGWIIVDAGWMALSRDRGTAGQAVDQGYGLVCDEEGNLLEDLVVGETNQEHGIIIRRNGGPLDTADFPPGRLLRILPNHACATAGMHDHYHLLKEGVPCVVLDRRNGW